MDDGFDWLDTLPEDLQGQIWHLMDCVAEGRHAQVDAIVPGIVARARGEQRPWVEIFARNFALRSQVLHREDIREGLGQAIELLDRAHAPDTRDCPQTICTAHAVCAAYGIKDPTGYIDERLAVSTETLSRTDPRRVCWLCISNEHADALLDAGRPDDALAFLDEQRRVRVAAGADVDPDDFGLRETAAHLLAGRLADAEKTLDAAFTEARGASWNRTWRQWKARLRAARGDADGAAPLISSVDDIIADGGFRLHFETLPLLFGALTPRSPDDARDDDGLDDDEILRQMCVLGQACIARGGGSGAGALIWAAERLAEGGEFTLARQALRAGDAGLALLRDAKALAARVAALDVILDAAVPPAAIAEPRDFETALAGLRADPRLERLKPLVSVARAFGMDPLAEALVAETRAAAPDDEALFHFAGRTLLATDAHGEALDRLVEHPPKTDDGPYLAAWLQGLAAERRGDVDAAAEHLTRVADARPDWTAVAEQLGGLHFDAARYAEADAVWAAAADSIGEPNVFHWHCLGAATAGDDWARIRELAGVIEFPLPDGPDATGPFEADYGLIRVQFEDDPRPFFATRVGPVAARIVSLRAPGVSDRHGDRVLFHPRVLNPDELDADPDAVRVHPVVHTLEAGGFVTVDLDGRHPGEAHLAALRSALTEAGYFHQLGADDDYEVHDPETGEAHPGVYLLVASRPDELKALEGFFATLKGPGPRVWSALLQHLQRADEAEAHRETARAWGMI